MDLFLEVVGASLIGLFFGAVTTYRYFKMQFDSQLRIGAKYEDEKNKRLLWETRWQLSKVQARARKWRDRAVSSKAAELKIIALGKSLTESQACATAAVTARHEAERDREEYCRRLQEILDRRMGQAQVELAQPKPNRKHKGVDNG